MTTKEVKLGQTKYFILQYLRANGVNLYSSSELGKALGLHHKTVALHLRDMREMGIIKDYYMGQNHTREITVTEEWQ